MNAPLLDALIWTRRLDATRLLTILLALTTTFLVLRLPGAVVLSLLIPACCLILCGLYRPQLNTLPLWAFLGLALISSTISALFSPVPPSPVNFAVLALTFTLFSGAILCTGAQVRAARTVMQTMYVTFGLTVLIGWGEVLTGFKLQRVLYPEASNLQLTGRFYVAAFFPNYNDFGVVVAMFSLMSFTRLLFDRTRRLRLALYAIAYLSGLILIIGGGSRGALIGLILGTALLIVTNLRACRPHLIHGSVVIVLGLTASAAALAVWSTPTIQDNSTQVRGVIVEQTIALSLNNQPTPWFGWGDLDAFHAAAGRAFPGILMDPHNLLLEIFTWFGLPALLAFIVLWIYVMWRGLWHLDISDDWVSLSSILLFCLTPVLGIVPSSTLRYYYIFLLAACSVAFLRGPDSPKAA